MQSGCTGRRKTCSSCAGDITYQRRRRCDGINDTTGKKNRWNRNRTGQRVRAPMPIQRKNRHGFAIRIGEFPISAYVRCMGSCKACSRRPGSLYRVFVRPGYRKKVESAKKKSKHLGKYDTPDKLCVKGQMDVKYVPKICCADRDDEVFFSIHHDRGNRQETVYLCVSYKEQSSFSAVDFVKRAITCFGYAPQTIQTDNGGEFRHTSKTKRAHPPNLFCQKNGIIHRTIRPRTPWRNGKAERDRRCDQERFYNDSTIA